MSSARSCIECGRRATHERDPSGEQGVVLVGAIVLLALIAAVGATTLWWTHSELWAAGSARALRQARYSAEAGVHHALALLAPGTDFAALRAGTGGLAWPDEPGPLPVAGGGWVVFPGPPFGYGVGVADDPGFSGAGSSTRAGERLRLRSWGTSVRGASRAVLGTIGREAEPYAPAALVAASGALAIEPGEATPGVVPSLVIDASQPPEGGQAALGAASAEGAIALERSGAELHGVPRSLEVIPIDIQAFLAAAGVTATRLDVGAAATPSDAASPGALLLANESVAGLVGDGLVAALGDLEIRGPIDFRGVLLVSGALRLSGVPCSVAGMVWARRVAVAGDCTIRHDRPAVTAADGALRLPRRAVLLSLVDE